MSIKSFQKPLVFIALIGLLGGLVFFPAFQAKAQSYYPLNTGGNVQTLPATNITASSALLNGSVTLPALVLPVNSPFSHAPQQVQYRFSFGSDPTLTVADHTNFSFAQNPGIGQGVFSNLVNLAAGTAYYYRLEVTLPNGFVMTGDTLSFNTLGNQGAISVVHTLGSVVNSDGSVTLKGQIDPMSSIPQYWFEYSSFPSMAFSLATPFQSAANASGYIDVFQTVPNFATGNVYYYRLVAQTAYGTMYGDVMSFGISSFVPSVAANNSGISYNTNGQTLYPSRPRVVTVDYSASENPVPSKKSSVQNKTAVVSSGANTSVQVAPLVLGSNSIPLEAASSQCVKMQSNLDNYQIASGGNVTYTVNVFNGCGALITNGVLFFGLPSNATLVSTNNSLFTENGQVVRYQLGSIPSGLSVVTSIVLKLSSSEEDYTPFISRFEYKDSAKKSHAIAAEVSVSISAGAAAASTISNNAASVVQNSGAFLGNSSFLLFLALLIAGLLIYKFFFSGKTKRGANEMKLGSLRIID